MKKLLMLLMLLASPLAYAADETKQPAEAPPDKNPACMDRTTNSATGDCIVRDNGKPRPHSPPKPITPTAPGPTVPRPPSAPPSAVQ